MKLVLKTASLSFFTLFLFFSSPHLDLWSAESYSSCINRCNAFEGQLRVTCYRTCSSTYKKHGKKRKKGNERYNYCKKLCKEYEGLENVKCIRICLEQNMPDSQQGSSTESFRSKKEVCNQRCQGLEGKLKYKCIKGCEKKEKYK